MKSLNLINKKTYPSITEALNDRDDKSQIIKTITHDKVIYTATFKSCEFDMNEEEYHSLQFILLSGSILFNDINTYNMPFNGITDIINCFNEMVNLFDFKSSIDGLNLTSDIDSNKLDIYIHCPNEIIRSYALDKIKKECS